MRKRSHTSEFVITDLLTRNIWKDTFNLHTKATVETIFAAINSNLSPIKVLNHWLWVTMHSITLCQISVNSRARQHVSQKIFKMVISLDRWLFWWFCIMWHFLVWTIPKSVTLCKNIKKVTHPKIWPFWKFFVTHVDELCYLLKSGTVLPWSCLGPALPCLSSDLILTWSWFGSD